MASRENCQASATELNKQPLQFADLTEHTAAVKRPISSGKKGTDCEHSYEMANCIVYDVGRAVVLLDRHFIYFILTSDITIMTYVFCSQPQFETVFETQVFITHHVINLCQTPGDFAPMP